MPTTTEKPLRRIDRAKMPLEKRMKQVKSALTVIGYKVESYSAVSGGRVFLRLKTHDVGGKYGRAKQSHDEAFMLVDGHKF